MKTKEDLHNPCTISQLSDEMGLLETGLASVYILNGKYEVPYGVDDGTNHILSHIKCPKGINIKSQPRPITCEEHRVG